MMLSNLMAIIGQQSWRDIILTALLASSILYFCVIKASDRQVVLSEEERKIRRDHLAKKAVERAKRIAADAAAAVESSSGNYKCIKEKRERNVSAKATSSNEQHATTTLSVKNDEISPKTQASNQIAKKSTLQNNQKSSVITKEDECASIEVTKQVAIAQKEVDDQLKKEENESDESSQLLTEKTNAIVGSPPSASNIKALQENDQESITIYLIKSSSPRIEVSIAKNTTLSELRKVVAAATNIPLTGLRHLLFRGRIVVEKNSTGNVVDEFGINEGSALHVVGKLSVSQQQENDQESISIYLINSSSPRIEITIAKNVTTPSKLRQVVAAATDIPLTGLRLIFRGRMIVEKSTGNVVDEFGIEEGSALHVVGKKRPEDEESDSSSLDDLFALGYADISDVSVTHQEQQQQQQPTSPPRQDMTRLIHHGLLVIPNFFHYAAASGIYDVIQAAIRDGSFNMELNRADENDWTPLHEAIRGGHHQVVTLLLDEGGLDMHAITNQGNGFSPLSLSIDLHGGDHPLTRMIRDRGGQEVWPKEEESESSSSSSSSEESFDDIYS